MQTTVRPGDPTRFACVRGIAALLLAAAGCVSAQAQSSTLANVIEDLDGDMIPDALGQTVTVRGIAVANEFSVTVGQARYYRVFMSDETAGILLQTQDASVISWVQHGDELEVTGTVGFHHGSPTITPTDATRLGRSQPPEPRPVSIADLNTDKYEGQLIVATGRLTNAQNIELVDGENAVRVRARNVLLQDLEFARKFRSGGNARVTGIASQYDPSAPHDGGYRIELLDPSNAIELLPDYRWAYTTLAVAVLIAFFAWLTLNARRQAERDRLLLRQVNASKQALTESEQKLQLVVSATSDVIWELFVDEDQLVWGSGSNELFQAPLELKAQTRADLFANVHSEDRQRVIAGFNAALDAKGGRWDDEYRVIRSDGSVLFLRNQAIIKRDNEGKPGTVVGALQDITEADEEKHRQSVIDARMQQSQRTESLGVLAGGIAHDFNNILAIIIGQAELLQQADVADDDRRRRSQEIVRAAMRGSNLSRRMLAYAGKAPVEKQQVSVNTIIRDISALLSEVLSKKVILVDELHSNLPPVLGDEGQLQQVIMNLVMNAIESIGNKSGQVKVSTDLRSLMPYEVMQSVSGTLPGDQVYVVITIEDNGVGMDSGTQARIFEPFFSSKGQSRGMGLSAVLGIINTHNGHLLLKSVPGEGSVFKVLLSPSVSAGDAPKEPTSPAVAVGTLSGDVLVADDEDGVREFASHALRSLGANVIEARNGEEAMAVFRHHPGELLLAVLDVSMPAVSGLEVYERIRELDADFPIVLFSGHGAYEVESQIDDARHLVVLSKPVSLRDFQQAIARLIPSAQSHNTAAG
ncbi:MAG: ATP-binding protein [Pseudomonadota bacterium]